MITLIKSLIILIFILTNTKPIRFMEVDFCTPVKLDYQHALRQLEGRMDNITGTRVVFKINAFRTIFYLNLFPDSNVLASLDRADLASVGGETRQCLYSGDVNTDPHSFAALSLCKGLLGIFAHNGTEYFISLFEGEETPVLGMTFDRTHVIRRRTRAYSGDESIGDAFARTCGVAQARSKVNLSSETLRKYQKGSELDDPTQPVMKWLGRSKRFASIQRFVEVLVVADHSMLKFHGDDLKHYLLTVMSATSRLYKHPSISNYINIVVVGLMVINEDEKGPKVSRNAALTLRNFCSWQKKMNNHNDQHPDYWDTAVLFTKQDLCGATTCDTLGIANVGSICNPRRSCSVIEDDGLPSALTTAHELGHVFNMPHDNVKACKEVFGTLRDNQMMSPTLIHIDRTWPWSVCSAAIMSEFLDGGHGDCLLDRPPNQLTLPEDLPGSSYSLHRQCEQIFGAGSRPCPNTRPCSKLWCTGKARGQLVCQTRHFPWADGTSCGNRRLCYRGGCVEKNSAVHIKVDGQWGLWGPFGVCSRTCAGGVKLARRECNNPVPENGGKYCYGRRIKYGSCNFSPCAETDKSYREEQCEAFGRLNLSTDTSPVFWVPKYSGISPKDKCKLICRAKGTGYFYVLAPKVVDGTPCSPDTSAVCVQGRCIKAGCDGMFNSNKKFDRCGVCGGDNQGCKKVSGHFRKPIHGYSFALTLPAGASSVAIRKFGHGCLASKGNYLAVKNQRGKYLLNGDSMVSAAEQDLLVRGSLLRYSGSSATVETILVTRPLQEPLTVELRSFGEMTLPRVRYSYFVHKESTEEMTVS